MAQSNSAGDRTDTHAGVSLALGFRPFYASAALFAVVALPLWLLAFTGIVPVRGALAGMHWHGHEMVFGFVPAVMAGFLLTAVRNWTGLPTPTGWPLAGLLVLWAAGRVFMVTGPTPLAVAVDIAFLPALALVIALPIRRSRNARNYKLLLVLAALTFLNAGYHAAHAGALPGIWASIALVAALDTITILMAIIGGRVIPAFTANAIPTATPRSWPGLEFVALGSLVLLLGIDVLKAFLALPNAAWVALLVAAAVAHAWRLALWQPQRTLSSALLWMLPVAYAWIPLSLALRTLSVAGVVPPAAGTHALTLGAISALIMAMMMRSSLGHTGRSLVAGAPEVSAFLLVQLAAVIRVLGTLADPGIYRLTVVASGILWTLAFTIFLARYGPMLARPRVDGKPG